ncbi:hypothetical protein [Polymorphospora lycopeni]|uniref:Uncharacterized protein n=1 Tax=Polymorphospora lycopeni TaxID=3140240 RepID=A0ABV5CKZ7_9ACTN
MSSFSDLYGMWRDLADAAEATGSREAQRLAAEAQKALSQHPQMREARAQLAGVSRRQAERDRRR